MSATTTIEIETTEVLGNSTCISRKDSHVLILSFIPITALLFNILVLVAVILYRSKLKQNNVYIYVFSVLMSNILFTTLSSYQLINHYHQFEGNPTKENSAVRQWWLFRKALTVATYLIMIGNIGALIYAIRAGNYVIAKAASLRSWSPGETKIPSAQAQRRKAYSLVAVAWTLPTTMSLLTLAGWNCSDTCECLSGCYSLENMETTPQRSCSRVFTPLSNSYMLVTVVVWTLEMSALFFMIFKTFRHSEIFSTNCMESDDKYDRDGLDRTDTFKVVKEDDKVMDKKQACESSTIDKRISCTDDKRSSIINDKNTVKGRRLERRKRRRARWLRTASKQLTYLTLLFFACTLPAMVCLLIDSVRQEYTKQSISSVLLSLPILYSIICPVILAKDLAGLKKAIIALIIKLFPSTKTTHHTGTTTYTSSTMSEADKSNRIITK
uniref:uncharacterized protein LOC120330338 n=1 Tax=Styela clava TaxID=7725 RepID=UPI001939B49B|nr:uncharacterized protein LOC120330338 [Styela clava]